MRRAVVATIGCITAMLFGGCPGVSGLGMHKSVPPTPVPPPAPVVKTVGAIGTKMAEVPFVVMAQASGPCIDFSISNTGKDPIEIKPSNFAFIPAQTRRSVPSEPGSAVVEVPPSVAPGETVKGRAVFNEFPSPAGSRLVFKPDNRATFAVILAGR